jgi:hypothetical protein
MKSFIVLILLAFAFFNEPANDVTKLKKTIFEFGNAVILSKNDPPAAFMMTLDDFKQVAQLSNKNLTDTELLNHFEKVKKRILYKYERIKTENPGLTEVVSFDSVTYKDDNLACIDVSIVFKYKDPGGLSYRGETQRMLFSFLVINKKLLITDHMRSISNFHYDLECQDLLEMVAGRSFSKSYYDYYFSTSINNAIPIRKKNKWGLISLKNNLLLPIIYDSIFPFHSDYARVKINGRYNLIDKKFMLYFDENQPNIKLVNDKYFVANQIGVYKPVFAEEPNQIIETIGEIQPVQEMNEPRKQPKKLIKVSLKDSLYDIYSNSETYKIETPFIRKEGGPSHYVINKKTHDTISTHYGYFFIDPHGPLIYGRRNDSTIIMELNGKILFKSYFVCQMESPGYVRIFDKNSRLFGIYCPFTNVYVKPIYRYIRVIDRDRLFVVITQKGKFGYLDATGKELFD